MRRTSFRLGQIQTFEDVSNALRELEENLGDPPEKNTLVIPAGATQNVFTDLTVEQEWRLTIHVMGTVAGTESGLYRIVTGTAGITVNITDPTSTIQITVGTSGTNIVTLMNNTAGQLTVKAVLEKVSLY